MQRHRTPTVEIIESIVNLLTFDFVTTGVVDNLDGTFTLTTCRTYHLQPGWAITIDGQPYIIVSVQRDINIVVSGLIEPPFANFAIYTPFYFHGTPVQTSAELTEIAVSKNKTPMVYLSEDLREKYNGRNSAIDRTAECRLFFLTQSETSWLTQKFHSDAIQPMTDLALEFIEKLRQSNLTGKFEDSGWEIITRQRVSIQTRGKGQQNFTNECLSGIELNIQLPIRTGQMICPCVVVVPSLCLTWEQMSAMTFEQLQALTWEQVSCNVAPVGFTWEQIQGMTWEQIQALTWEQLAA